MNENIEYWVNKIKSLLANCCLKVQHSAKTSQPLVPGELVWVARSSLQRLEVLVTQGVHAACGPGHGIVCCAEVRSVHHLWEPFYHFFKVTLHGRVARVKQKQYTTKWLDHNVCYGLLESSYTQDGVWRIATDDNTMSFIASFEPNTTLTLPTIAIYKYLPPWSYSIVLYNYPSLLTPPTWRAS